MTGPFCMKGPLYLKLWRNSKKFFLKYSEQKKSDENVYHIQLSKTLQILDLAWPGEFHTTSVKMPEDVLKRWKACQYFERAPFRLMVVIIKEDNLERFDELWCK